MVDPVYAARVGERGREAVREFLDADKIAAQRELVYHEAISTFYR